MRTAICFACKTELSYSSPRHLLLVRLYELGWRLVEVRGLKWPHCPSCITSSGTRAEGER